MIGLQKKLKEFMLQNDRIFLLVLKIYAAMNSLISISRNGDKILISKNKNIIKIAYQNRVYAFSIVKEFDYFSSSVEGVFDKGLYVFDFSQPKFHRIPGINRDFFYISLPEGQETNDTYLEYLRLKAGDVILDLGAYCGLATYEFSKIAGDTGLVISVEPDSANYLALTKNVESLKMLNVKTLNGAVWDSDTKLTFNCENSLGSAVSGCVDRASNIVSIQAYSLNSIVSNFGLEKIDAVKMDVEGSEYSIFSNIEDLLGKFKPKLIMEVHKNSSGVIDIDYFRQKLEKCGYKTTLVKQSEKEAFPLLYAEYAG